MKTDYFLLPQMEDCVVQVGSVNYVNKINLLKENWQVHLSQAQRQEKVTEGAVKNSEGAKIVKQ